MRNAGDRTSASSGFGQDERLLDELLVIQGSSLELWHTTENAIGAQILR